MRPWYEKDSKTYIPHDIIYCSGALVAFKENLLTLTLLTSRSTPGITSISHFSLTQPLRDLGTTSNVRLLHVGVTRIRNASGHTIDDNNLVILCTCFNVFAENFGLDCLLNNGSSHVTI